MKKITKNNVVLGIIGVFILAFFVNSVQIKAVTEDEVQNIETNVAVEDVLESSGDVKYYKFTMDKTGYFQVLFDVVEIGVDTEDGWTITILDSDGNSTISSFTRTGDSTLPKFAFEEGKTFYLKIEAYRKNIYDAPIDVKYQFTVNTYENNSWESEYNDSVKDADNINVNSNYCANLYYSSDVDYYHFVMDRTGYFDISFTIPEVDAEVEDGWKVTVFREDENVNSFIVTSNMTTCPYAFKKGTNIYIKVEATRSNIYDAPIFTEYNLKVNATTSSVWEKESNDSLSNASSMDLSKTYSGSTYKLGDVDYYKVKLSGKGFMTVYFDPNELSDNLKDGYDLEIYNSSNAKIYSSTSITSKSNSKLYLNKGTYYIKIDDHSRSSYDCPSEYIIYKLKATYTVAAKPGKVTIRSVKGSTYNSWFNTYDDITYKLKSVKNASGYQVQISTSKKFNKNKTTVFSDISGRIGSQLKRKTKYYVRARAYYETPTGSKTYGNWSNIKSVKTK